MATWTAEKRRDLPLSRFGEPGKRAFPIEDQSDLDDAAKLIGKADDPAKVKARLKRIAKELGLKVPEAWRTGRTSDDATLSVAAFSLGEPEADDDEYVVYQNSKLFEIGDYPDKDFSMTAEEMRRAQESFSGAIPIGLEHVPTVLDGKLGEVRDIRLSADSRDLLGTVAIPRWLDGVLDKDKRKVSCHWHRPTKTLKKLDLVVSPRVADAALMAAFGRSMHRTPQGQAAHQAIHDMTAGYGAVCTSPNSGYFHSGRERSGLQKIHDLATDHGARCSVMMSYDPASDSLVPAASPASAPRAAAPPKGTVTMSEKKEGTAQPGEIVTPPAAEATVDFSDHPAFQAIQAKLDKAQADIAVFAASNEDLRNQVQQTRKRELATDAAEFAAAVIKDERALPSMKADLISEYVQAATFDARVNEKVTFSAADGEVKEGSAVEALKARWAKRPRHRLMSESLADLPEGAEVLFTKSAPASAQPDPKRVDELIAKHSTIANGSK